MNKGEDKGFLYLSISEECVLHIIIFSRRLKPSRPPTKKKVQQTAGYH